MLLLYCSILSPLIPVIIGYKNAGKLLWWYPFLGFLVDASVFVLKRTVGLNTFQLDIFYNSFLIIEFVLITTLYNQVVLQNNRWVKMLIGATVGLFLVYCFWTYCAFSFLIFSAFLSAYLLLTLYSFYIIIHEQKNLFLEKYWFFWFNVAVLLYASANIIFFLFIYFYNDVYKGQVNYVWERLFLASNIIKNLLLVPAVYLYGKVLKNIPPE